MHSENNSEMKKEEAKVLNTDKNSSSDEMPEAPRYGYKIKLHPLRNLVQCKSDSI
jgi:hypothetical protein